MEQRQEKRLQQGLGWGGLASAASPFPQGKRFQVGIPQPCPVSIPALTQLSAELKDIPFLRGWLLILLSMLVAGALKKIKLGLYQYKGEITICKNTFCLSW